MALDTERLALRDGGTRQYAGECGGPCQRRRGVCHRLRHVAAGAFIFCLPALVCAQDTPFENLRAQVLSLDERIHPCKDANGATYSTSRLKDKCMETERIIIDGQKRLLAICQEQDTRGITQVNSCPAGTCRSETIKEVFPDARGVPTLIEEANFYIFEKKQAIRECVFASSVQHERNEDFLAIVQEVLYRSETPGLCTSIAVKICRALGGDPSAMTEQKEETKIDESECCALSELPNSWTIESPELFQVLYGSVAPTLTCIAPAGYAAGILMRDSTPGMVWFGV